MQSTHLVKLTSITFSVNTKLELLFIWGYDWIINEHAHHRYYLFRSWNFKYSTWAVIWNIHCISRVIDYDRSIIPCKLYQLLQLVPCCCRTGWIVWRTKEDDICSCNFWQIRKETILWCAFHVFNFSILLNFLLEQACLTNYNTGVYISLPMKRKLVN